MHRRTAERMCTDQLSTNHSPRLRPDGTVPLQPRSRPQQEGRKDGQTDGVDLVCRIRGVQGVLRNVNVINDGVVGGERKILFCEGGGGDILFFADGGVVWTLGRLFNMYVR
jgi:hypothetical protein